MVRLRSDRGGLGPDRRPWRFARLGLCAAHAAHSPDRRRRTKPERDAERNTQRDTLALALSISASHGLLLLSPVPIAAAAIIGAEWNRVALFGLPLAILLAACGAILARWSSPVGAAPELLSQATLDGAAKRSDGYPIVLLLAIAIPLLLLMVQSIGDIPSEPLGGGPARELVLGIGRPLILFLVGVGIMMIGQLRRRPQPLCRSRLDRAHL